MLKVLVALAAAVQLEPKPIAFWRAAPIKVTIPIAVAIPATRPQAKVLAALTAAVQLEPKPSAFWGTAPIRVTIPIAVAIPATRLQLGVLAASVQVAIS